MANKVVVIPEEMWNATEARMKAEPMRKSLEEIAVAIERLLENEKIADGDKIKLLAQMQQRYNRIYDGRIRNVELSIKDEEKMRPDVQELVKYMRPPTRENAEQILKYMEWDAKNQLVIDGSPIPGSNIIDLVHNAVDPLQPSHNPIGYEQFREKLMKLNVPHHLLAKRAPIRVATKKHSRKPKVPFSIKTRSSKQPNLSIKTRSSKQPKVQWKEYP
jgi:hypothetical protein